MKTEKIRNMEEALLWLESPAGASKRADLEAFALFMDRMGAPYKKRPVVHIAGTNGKGSTAAMTAAVLEAAGYRTGLYTSPHLVRYNERIRLNGEDIGDEDFIRLADEIADEEDKQEIALSVFQRMTAMAFLYYAKMPCDVIVLEVGMGGAWDATNIVTNTLASVITPISLEHTAQLGRTVAEIAAVKSGILRPGRPVVVSAQTEEALSVIRERAAALNCPVTVSEPGEGRVLSFTLKEQKIEYRGKSYALNLAGSYQYDNAVTVLETIDALRGAGLKIPEDAVRKGLDSVSWPVRFEFIRTKPPLFLDGAHNPGGVRELERCLRDYFGPQKLTMICSIMSDKDRRAMLSCLKPHIGRLIVVRSHSPRSLEAAFLAEEIRRVDGIDAVAEESIEAGLDRLLREQGDSPAGSFGCLYLAGELRKMLT